MKLNLGFIAITSVGDELEFSIHCRAIYGKEPKLYKVALAQMNYVLKRFRLYFL